MTIGDKWFALWAAFALPFFVGCSSVPQAEHRMSFAVHQVEDLAATCGPGVLACAVGSQNMYLPAWKEPRTTYHYLVVRTGPPRVGCGIACGADNAIYVSALAWCGSVAHFIGEAIVDATGAPVPSHQWWLLGHELRHLWGDWHPQDYKCRMPA